MLLFYYDAEHKKMIVVGTILDGRFHCVGNFHVLPSGSNHCVCAG